VPLAGHTLKLVSATVVELQSRPDHQVAQACWTPIPRWAPANALTRAPNVDADTTNVRAAPVALTGV
jgi:hypothetical protein